MISQWNGLNHILEEHQATYMLWEGEPLQESVSKLMSKGIGSVIFSPSANRPEEGDFMTVMQKNIADLELVYR
jgi:zinc transport system substrate-binding protein